MIIDTRPWLDRQVLITNWALGIQFYQKNDNNWEPECIDPGFALITREHLENKSAPIYDYLKQMPNWVIDDVKHYEYRQFILLKLISLYPSSRDIFNHSPNLVWLACIESMKCHWTLDELVNILHYKRENIVKKLFVRGSKKLVRFISKIKLYEGNQNEYKLIQTCLSNHGLINSFSHWKIIPVQALIVVSHFPNLVKTSLLDELIDDQQSLIKQKVLFSRIATIVEDIDNMAEMMEVTFPATYYLAFRTKQEVERAHDQLVARFNLSDKVSLKGVTTFPACPLGTILGQDDELIQITNSFELSTEGREMHHCVGGYVRQAGKGECYFFKVLSPERGTLQLGIRDDKFSILQFKLACNKTPSEASWFHAKQIITSASMLLDKQSIKIQQYKG